MDSELAAEPDAPPDLALSRGRYHGLEHTDSAVPAAELKKINKHINAPPEGFTPHPTASRLLQRRLGIRDQQGSPPLAEILSPVLIVGDVSSQAPPILPPLAWFGIGTTPGVAAFQKFQLRSAATGG